MGRRARSWLVVMVVTVLASFGMTGCGAWYGGSGPEFTKPALVEGKASLVLYRTSAFIRHRAYDVVKVNDVVVTSVTNGGWYAIPLDPGRIVIQTKPRLASALGGLVAGSMGDFETVKSFNAEAGKGYYIRFDRPGVFSMRSRFFPIIVEEAEALKELEGLQQFEADEKAYAS